LRSKRRTALALDILIFSEEGQRTLTRGVHRNKKGRRMSALGHSRRRPSEPVLAHVRFAPKADKRADVALSRLSAISRHRPLDGHAGKAYNPVSASKLVNRLFWPSLVIAEFWSHLAIEKLGSS
jgi:hypothetical protein